MKILTAVVLIIGTGSGMAFSQLPPFQFLQKPGPYPVGLRVGNQYDSSRAALTEGSFKTPPNGKGRPLQILIWYPAQQSASKSMTVEDYVELADTEIQFDTPDRVNNKWRSRLKSSFGVPLRAVRDAKSAQGHYPILIYAPSDSSVAWENADLCEYLASHGYVVLASPSVGVSTRDMTDDLAGIESQALDISFLITYAKTVPDTDSTKIGVVSFSWGGISSLFAASRDFRIQILAEMDGSMRYYPGLVWKAGNIHPEQLKIPLLFFTANNTNRIEELEDYHGPAGDIVGRSVLNAWTHADVLTVNMLGMSHPEFCSMFERLKTTAKDFSEDQVADYARDEANTSYSWTALYTLQFLNAYLRNDASAKAFLERVPTENGVPQHIMGVIFRAADSFSSVVTQAAKQGYEQAWAAYQTYINNPTHRHVENHEKTINRLGYIYLAQKDVPTAIVLFRLNTAAYPESANAYDSLGDGYEAAQDERDALEAYKKSVQLNPNNQHAKREIVRLESSR